jgi:uncharacterized DUF497 family protein
MLREGLSYGSEKFNWDVEKNTIPKSSKGITFEDSVYALYDDRLLDIIPSPTHRNQLCFAVEVEKYVYIVPFVEEDEHTIFLKTIYPSRKHTKFYLRGGK